jgi:hypothetical protein
VEEFAEYGAMRSGKNIQKFASDVLDGYCCTLPRNVGRTAGALDGLIYIQEIVICF